MIVMTSVIAIVSCLTTKDIIKCENKESYFLKEKCFSDKIKVCEEKTQEKE